MYVVIENFADLQDDGYRYKKGDIYPREGKEVSEARSRVLLSDVNRQRKPLIKEVIEKPIEVPKPIEKAEEKPIEADKETVAKPKRKKSIKK